MAGYIINTYQAMFYGKLFYQDITGYVLWQATLSRHCSVVYCYIDMLLNAFDWSASMSNLAYHNGLADIYKYYIYLRGVIFLVG